MDLMRFGLSETVHIVCYLLEEEKASDLFLVGLRKSPDPSVPPSALFGALPAKTSFADALLAGASTEPRSISDDTKARMGRFLDIASDASQRFEMEGSLDRIARFKVRLEGTHLQLGDYRAEVRALREVMEDELGKVSGFFIKKDTRKYSIT